MRAFGRRKVNPDLSRIKHLESSDEETTTEENEKSHTVPLVSALARSESS